MSARPNTPGFVGYAVMCTTSFLVYGTVVAAGIGDPALAPVVVAIVAVFGLPVAIVGAAVIHLSCFEVESQEVHVAVAGLTATFLSYAYLAVFGADPVNPLTLLLAALAGASAAIGRFVVIPRVGRRRDQLAPDTPLRIPLRVPSPDEGWTTAQPSCHGNAVAAKSEGGGERYA